ncbi:hypothetical protein GALMADRAFT_80797 [Galerina marginata CBS 339.88]|uniref:NACHT domain-containing protein n=1 Tax=Galerina marginata (strain CBS 339.88) TaxID=685588 RepID=A0A067SFJ6_GALM3|nr:hypothetical protein GALMADRAFT_80797 [Galerina marginata CBS 339.88]
MNPVKIAAGIVKIVLQIKDVRHYSSHLCPTNDGYQDVKGNIDAVDQRILSTADQLDTVGKALAGWQPHKAEEMQGMRLYQTTLIIEWTNLIELKKQSTIRKIAVHEEDKKKIADIFERINRAREQLVKLLLERLEASHAADHKSELEGDQRQLLRRAVCTPGTRVRILSDIARWANDTSPESQSVYWLSGQAGSGKSTIAYTIARRFEFASDADDTIVLGGNFFCSRQIMETRSAIRIIRTIVYHLALKSKAFADALRASGNFSTIHQSVGAQLEGLLIEPWKKAQLADASKSPCFLVVIDALDEIEGRDGSEFLRELLDSINKHHLRGLKFLVTSRPDPSLETHLGSFEDKQFYRLEKVPIGEAEADIMTYLNANLGHSVGCQRIAAQAAGLFIYAATVVKYVEGYASVEYEERLSTLFVSDSNNSEETLLDVLYCQVLLDARCRFKSRHYLNVLYTFLCTAERTSTSVVAELLFPPNLTNPTNPYTEIIDGVAKSLHAVLYIENNKVLSYHKSFTDFMFDQNRAKEFWCDQAKHHRFLTDSCFRIMDGLKFNIADIESSFVLDCDNSALPEAVKQNISPVLSYSCRNWDYHLSAVAPIDSNALCETLSEFLQLRVLFWMEALNLLGSRGQCEQMLQKAYKWAGSTISAVSYSSDDKCIVSGSFDKLVRVWDASTGGMLKVLGGHTGAVLSVAFSGDDKCIVSGSYDKSVRVWDASAGEMLKVLEGHTEGVWSVAFSSDNECIVSGSEDKSVRVWDASTGEMLKVLEGHTDSVWSVAFSSDDKCIVSGSLDKSVRVWDASTGEMLKVLEGHTDICIVSGSEDKSVRVWDASTGEMLKVLEGHNSSVSSVAFSSDDKRIISGSLDKLVRVWDVSTDKMLKVLEGHTAAVSSVTFSSDDKCIVSGSVDKSVRVWDASTGEMLKVLEGHTESVWSVAFSSDNECIVCGSEDKSVRLWDASTGEMLKVLEGHTEGVSSVAFSSDDKCICIVSGSLDKSVRVWDASTGDVLKVLEGHNNSVLSVAFSRDDKCIVSGSFDKSLRLWDASTGGMLKVLEGHTDGVLSVAFSGDDKCIVSGSYDNSVRVWDASTGEMLKKITDSSGYQRHTGWLLSPQEEHYLMFVPLSANLPDLSNILTLPRSHAASVDFTSSTLGPEWHKCFSESS